MMSVSVVARILERHRSNPAAAIAVLQDLQKELRWLPEPALRLAALRLGVPLTQIYGLATFYHSFSLKPRGRHLIQLCLGTACHVRGAPRIETVLRDQLKVDLGGVTADERFSVESVRCVGCCGLAPVVVIDEEFHGNLEAKDVPKILEKYA